MKSIYENYDILNLIGSGNNADVYLARKKDSEQIVACKLYASGNTLAVESMEREADILAMLDHPAIPRPLEQLAVEEGRALIMTYMPGITPTRLCPEDFLPQWDKMPVRSRALVWEAQVASWGSQICHVLQYLHEREDPLIYGDLKPANLRIHERSKYWTQVHRNPINRHTDKLSEVTFVDFGSVIFQSMVCENGTDKILLTGTPGYAAPEQYADEPGTAVPQSDLYALGRILRLWMGDIPCSGTMERLLRRCTERKVSDRWKSAAELRIALQGLSHLRSGQQFLRENW